MPKKIGLVTIGQSPRDDLNEDFLKNFPNDIEVVQAGALDNLNSNTITTQLSARDGEILYVTRLRTVRR